MNPLGTDGFEFVEFTSPDPNALAERFSLLGFTAVGRHRSKNVFRYRQGDINFLLNMEPTGQAAEFRGIHGPSANAMAFRVRDAPAALELAVRRGAVPVAGPVGPMELNIPAIEGIGGSNLYLVDRYGAQEIYDVDFVPIEGAAEQVAENSVGLTTLDHLTHNLYRGNLMKWASFYERIFDFRHVGNTMVSCCGKIRIPLHESQDGHSEIEAFLVSYNGEGIQHLALGTGDIYFAVERMRARGIAFQNTPDSYYETLDARMAGHGEDLERLRRLRVLMQDAPPEGRGILLQIETANAVGPIHFEIIQRKDS